MLNSATSPDDSSRKAIGYPKTGSNSHYKDVQPFTSFTPESIEEQSKSKYNSYPLHSTHDYQISGGSVFDSQIQKSNADSTPPKDLNNREVQPFLPKIPEMSVEHSEGAKLSMYETSGNRALYDTKTRLHSNRSINSSGHKSYPDLRSDTRRSPRSNRYKTLTTGVDDNISLEVDNRSPHFQIDGPSMKRSKSTKDKKDQFYFKDNSYMRDKENSYQRDLSYSRPYENDRSYRYNQRDHSYTHVYDKKSMDDQNMFSQSKSFYAKSGESSITSTLKKSNTLGSGKYSARKYSPHKNDDYDREDKFAERKLNLGDGPVYSRTESSFFKREPNDLVEMLNAERMKNEKLEERIKSKNKILEELKESYRKLLDANMEAKDTIRKLQNEKENVGQNNSRAKNQIESLKGNLTLAEERAKKYQKQYEDIKNKDSSNRILVENLSNENSKLKNELAQLLKKFESRNERIAEYEGKIEALSAKNKKLERDNLELQELKRVSESRLIRDSDNEKLLLRQTLEEASVQVKSLTQRNLELTTRLDALKKYNEEKDRTYLSRIDDSVEGTKRVMEEKMEEMRSELRSESKRKSNKYKAKIAALEAENENLRSEINKRAPMRRLRDTEAKVQTLESEIELIRSRSNSRERSEVGFTKKLVRELFDELRVENVGEILPAIKELMKENKSNAKFVGKIVELVSQCSPPGHFRGKPTNKDAWAWLKRLMEEYMQMKKVNTNSVGSGSDSRSDRNKEIVKIITETLNANDKAEVISKLKLLLHENIVLHAIAKKVRLLHGLEWVESLKELDSQLEIEADRTLEEPYNKLKYYKMNHS